METAGVPLQHGIGKDSFGLLCPKVMQDHSSMLKKVKTEVEEEEGEFRISVK